MKKFITSSFRIVFTLLLIYFALYKAGILNSEGREKFLRISKKLAAEGIYSFSIGKDGLCTIRTEKGFRRVAAIRDFPADKRILIKKELEKEGGYSVIISGRYMWITRR